MASIHPLGPDLCVLSIGATLRLTFLRGQLELLLDEESGVRTRRVPLLRGRDEEAGELTLSRTGRTLEARLFDPARLYLGKAADARAMLRGDAHAVSLFDATDDDAAPGDPAPPVRVEPPRARVPDATPPPAPRAEASLDEVRRAIHKCPEGLTCRPGRGALYPLAPQGRPAADGRADVLLVGWNPRNDWYDRPDRPPLGAWTRMAEAALGRHEAARDAWARRLGPVLPPGRRLSDDGVMRTFLWKWPTRVKTAGEATDVYAARCTRAHFDDELAALRPRVVLTYESEAADWLAARAEAMGLRVKPPGASVRAAEVRGWVEPSDAWGWRMALVLLRDAGDAYDDLTVRYAHAALARALGLSG